MATAAALEKAGHTVAFVALLDCYPASDQEDGDSLMTVLPILQGNFGKDLAAVSENGNLLLLEGARMQRSLLALSDEERAQRISELFQTTLDEETREVLEKRLALAHHHHRLFEEYRPFQIRAQMNIFWATRLPEGKHSFQRLPWETWTSGQSRVEAIDADHFTMMQQPAVRTVAARISESLMSMLRMKGEPGS